MLQTINIFYVQMYFPDPHSRFQKVISYNDNLIKKLRLLYIMLSVTGIESDNLQKYYYKGLLTITNNSLLFP